MSLKESLKRQLSSARQFSDQILTAFKTPQDWTKQVHDNANHALWFAGHMGVSDNFFVSVLAPNNASEPPEFSAKFGMGSQPVDNPNEYPSVETVLQYMRNRRETLLGVLDGMTEEELSKRLPAGTPDFLSTAGSVFEMAVWHEGMHSGQLTVCRRALGHKPMF